MSSGKHFHNVLCLSEAKGMDIIMKKYMISIVIPIFNAEKVINRCMQSIIREKFDDVQVILVDDGSTDESYNICLEWKKNTDYVEVIHTRNNGVSAARNRGILEAKGEYVLFLDADDWLLNGWYEEINALMDKKYDLILFSYKVVYEDKRKNYEVHSFCEGKIKVNQVYESLATTTYMNFCWGKLIKLSFLRQNNILFSVGKKIGEDSEFQFKILQFAPSIYYRKFSMISYYQGEDSVMHRFEESKFKNLEEDFIFRKNVIKKIEQVTPETYNGFYNNLAIILISYTIKLSKIKNKKEFCLFMEQQKEKSYYQEIVNKTKFSSKRIDKQVILTFLRKEKWKILYFIFRQVNTKN